MKFKGFIIAVVALGLGAFAWATYRTLAGTTHSGQARSAWEAPFVGTSLEWLRPRGPVVFYVHEHARGKIGFVSGEASGDVTAAAKDAGFRTDTAEDMAGDMVYRIRVNVADPQRYALDFGDDDGWYRGPAPGWDSVQVFYRKSDRRFTAEFFLSTDKGR